MFAGNRLNALLALIFLGCAALPASEALNLNYTNLCLLIHNNEFIASGDSCSDYYYCQNGVAVLETCPSGLYFSKDSQSCQPASTVNCFGSMGQPCSGANIGTWAPVSGSCTNYYYCSANGPELGECPLGENFNPTAQACQFASQYPCGIITNPGTGDSTGSGETPDNGVNLCSFMPNGVFFGSASSCSDWYLCTNNALTTGTCPTGYVFNTQIGQCDYPSATSCAQVTNDPNLTNSPTIGGPCTAASPQMKAASQCNAYYVCNGVNYQLFYCPSTQFYDVPTGTCVSRLNARNNCDRCQGSTANFVNAYSTTNCANYLRCQNGVEQSIGTCPPGSYFSEVAGGCMIGNDPDFGCCNPSAFYGTTPEPSAASTGSTASVATTKASGTTETTDAPTTTTVATTTTKQT